MALMPAWEIALGDGHQLALNGRIDRVDLWRVPGSDDALAVVLDYKSSKKVLDKVLIEHGVQLQLLGYLTVLRHWPNPQQFLSCGTFDSGRRFLSEPARRIQKRRHP